MSRVLFTKENYEWQGEGILNRFCYLFLALCLLKTLATLANICPGWQSMTANLSLSFMLMCQSNFVYKIRDNLPGDGLVEPRNDIYGAANLN
jgi:hypothetical protein